MHTLMYMNSLSEQMLLLFGAWPRSHVISFLVSNTHCVSFGLCVPAHTFEGLIVSRGAHLRSLAALINIKEGLCLDIFL